MFLRICAFAIVHFGLLAAKPEARPRIQGLSATRKGAEEQNQVTSVKNTTKDRRI